MGVRQITPGFLSIMAIETVSVRDVYERLHGKSWKYIRKGASVSLLTFVGFGLLTDLIPNPVFSRMVSRSPLDYVFLTLTALLAGVYIAQRSRLNDATGENCALGGTVGGFLAFGCPLCNHILLALFSSTAIMAYFNPLRPLLGVVAVALLAGGIYYQRHEVACETDTEPAPPD